MACRNQLLLAYIALCLVSLYHANPMRKEKLQLLGFSWQDCGAKSLPDHVTALTVTPDPIHVPGNITVATTVDVSTATPTDVSLAVTVEKKVAGFWIKVPCIDKIGSCTYDDVCTEWAKVCPTYFAKYGLPCTCPFPAKTYSISDVVLDITEKLPPGSTGDIRVTVNFVSKSVGTFSCLQLVATVAAS